MLNPTSYYIVQSPQQREETFLLDQLIQHIKDSLGGETQNIEWMANIMNIIL